MFVQHLQLTADPRLLSSNQHSVYASFASSHRDRQADSNYCRNVRASAPIVGLDTGSLKSWHFFVSTLRAI